jgi:hypothetical protein
LAAAYHLRYIHEPANPTNFPAFTTYYQMVDAPNELERPYGFALANSSRTRLYSAVAGPYQHWPSRLRIASNRAPALIKDPFAFFNAELMRTTYDMEIVLCVRHPAGVVSSAMRLGWNFDFQQFIGNPSIIGELVNRREEMIARVFSPTDVLEEIALLWSILHSWWRASGTAPKHYVRASHDSLIAAENGLAHLLPERTADHRALSVFLESTHVPVRGGPDTARFDDVTREPGSLAKPWRRRLSGGQIARIRAIVGEEASHWGFGDDTW